MYQGASAIMRKTLDWKHSWICMFEVEAVPHRCIPQVQIGLSIALYIGILLLVESLDFRPSSECILVTVIPSCFRFVNMCLQQVSLLSRCNQRYLTSSCRRRCMLFIWTGRQVSLHVVNVTWTNLDSLTFIMPL
jgi:hypothetical protein